MAGERISEEAVEAAAEALWELDQSHDSIHRGRRWDTAASVDAMDYGKEVERMRARMQYALEAAYPAILSDLRRELLSDEAVEAALENGWGVHPSVASQRERESERKALEAALDALDRSNLSGSAVPGASDSEELASTPSSFPLSNDSEGGSDA